MPGEKGMTIGERIDKYTDWGHQEKSCSIWTAAVTKFGYPILGTPKGTTGLVHLLLAEMHKIPKPHGTMCITRTCGNLRCVNFRHLKWVPRSEINRVAQWKHWGTEKRLKKQAAKRAAAVRKYDCKTCGKILSAWYTSKKYCSQECINAQHVGIEKICQYCHKKFVTKIGKPNKILCSEKCDRKRLQAHALKLFMPPKILVYFRQCIVCDQYFYTRSQGKKRKCCSEQHTNEYHRLRIISSRLQAQP